MYKRRPWRTFAEHRCQPELYGSSITFLTTHSSTREDGSPTLGFVCFIPFATIERMESQGQQHPENKKFGDNYQ